MTNIRLNSEKTFVIFRFIKCCNGTDLIFSNNQINYVDLIDNVDAISTAELINSADSISLL